MLCDALHDKRDTWAKKIEKSFNDVAKKAKVTMSEMNIVKEMIKEIVKNLNKEKKIGQINK